MLEVLSLPWRRISGPIYMPAGIWPTPARSIVADRVLKNLVQKSSRRDALEVLKWLDVDVVVANTGDPELHRFVRTILVARVVMAGIVVKTDFLGQSVRAALSKKMCLGISFRFEKSMPLRNFIIDDTVVHFHDALCDEQFVTETWDQDFDFRQLTENDIVRVCNLYNRELNRRQEKKFEDKGKVEVVFQSLDKQWTLVELKDQQAFTYEGWKMGHCVAQYYHHGSSHQKILSLRVKGEPVVTIEMRGPNKWSIVQAKGAYNSTPAAETMEFVRHFEQHYSVVRNMVVLKDRSGGPGHGRMIIDWHEVIRGEVMEHLEADVHHIQAQNRLLRHGVPNAPVVHLFHDEMALRHIEEFYFQYFGRTRRRRAVTVEPFKVWTEKLERIRSGYDRDPSDSPYSSLYHSFINGGFGYTNKPMQRNLCKYLTLRDLSLKYESFCVSQRLRWIEEKLVRKSMQEFLSVEPMSSVEALLQPPVIEKWTWFPKQPKKATKIHDHQMVILDSLTHIIERPIHSKLYYSSASKFKLPAKKSASPYPKPKLKEQGRSWAEVRKELLGDKPW